MEIWKDIKGFEGVYQISNFGNVKSFTRSCLRKDGRGCVTTKGRNIKKINHNKGYYQVILSNGTIKKHCLIHRLVAETFISNLENKRCVNHIDGNKQNNLFSNLEWATYSENNKHAYDIKLKIPYDRNGNKSPNSKLTDKDVLEIRNSNLSAFELSVRYNLLPSSIRNILKRRSWKHI